METKYDICVTVQVVRALFRHVGGEGEGQDPAQFFLVKGISYLY
jgi:hypothetical protein